MIACERQERVCLAMELDPGWCDVVVERWEQVAGHKATRRQAARFSESAVGLVRVLKPFRTGNPGNGQEERRMATKQAVKPEVRNPIVQFQFEDRTYQIDPRLRKVYRRFVEIETSRAAEIFSVWRRATA